MGRDELKIVAAAIKVGDKVWQGKRHGCIMPLVFAETGLRISMEQQGFVASDGKFYNRFQSGAVAFRAGQTKTRKQSLMSEDVW